MDEDPTHAPAMMSVRMADDPMARSHSSTMGLTTPAHLSLSLSRAHQRNQGRKGGNCQGFADGARFLFFTQLLRSVH
jgi:hypothetical protein